MRGGTLGVNEWGEVNHWLAAALIPRLGFVEGRDITMVETGRAQGDSWNVPRPADALILHPPEPYAAIAAGWTMLVDMRTLNVPFQLSCITGRRDWIDAHRADMLQYLAGHVQGIVRFNRDRAFGLAVSRKWGPKVAEAVIERTWEFASTEFCERPFPTVAAIEGILASMRGHVVGAETARAADFVDDSLMQELDRTGILDEIAGVR